MLIKQEKKNTKLISALNTFISFDKNECTFNSIYECSSISNQHILNLTGAQKQHNYSIYLLFLSCWLITIVCCICALQYYTILLF